MKEEQIKKVLDLHKKWLNNEGGAKADLREADFRGANLRSADLRGADLRGANLNEADIWDVDLSGANLNEAKNY